MGSQQVLICGARATDSSFRQKPIRAITSKATGPLLDTGHPALETHIEKRTVAMRRFQAKTTVQD